MRALVVYESMFGNTREIAHAVARGLASHGEVRIVEVADAPPGLDGVDLVVVGGPTHAFGMSRKSTREAAAQQGPQPLVSPFRGIREWMDTLPASASVLGATFDTKVHKARRLPGAARSAAKALRRHRVRVLLPPESFSVEDTIGPLLEGELDRAWGWGALVGQAAEAARRGRPVGDTR